MVSYRIERIRRAVADLCAAHQSRDPFVLAEAEGLEVVYRSFDELRGFYTRLSGHGFIVINQELSRPEKRLICAHELGHDQLHRELAEDRLVQEFAILDLRRQPEYEANLFAADLLLEDEVVLEGLRNGMSLGQLAAELGIQHELLYLKLKLLGIPGADHWSYDDKFLRRKESES